MAAEGGGAAGAGARAAAHGRCRMGVRLVGSLCAADARRTGDTRHGTGRARDAEQRRAGDAGAGAGAGRRPGA